MSDFKTLDIGNNFICTHQGRMQYMFGREIVQQEKTPANSDPGGVDADGYPDVRSPTREIFKFNNDDTNTFELTPQVKDWFVEGTQYGLQEDIKKLGLESKYRNKFNYDAYSYFMCASYIKFKNCAVLHFEFKGNQLTIKLLYEGNLELIELEGDLKKSRKEEEKVYYWCTGNPEEPEELEESSSLKEERDYFPEEEVRSFGRQQFPKDGIIFDLKPLKGRCRYLGIDGNIYVMRHGYGFHNKKKADGGKGVEFMKSVFGAGNLEDAELEPEGILQAAKAAEFFNSSGKKLPERMEYFCSDLKRTRQTLSIFNQKRTDIPGVVRPDITVLPYIHEFEYKALKPFEEDAGSIFDKKDLKNRARFGLGLGLGGVGTGAGFAGAAVGLSPFLAAPAAVAGVGALGGLTYKAAKGWGRSSKKKEKEKNKEEGDKKFMELALVREIEDKAEKSLKVGLKYFGKNEVKIKELHLALTLFTYIHGVVRAGKYGGNQYLVKIEQRITECKEKIESINKEIQREYPLQDGVAPAAGRLPARGEKLWTRIREAKVKGIQEAQQLIEDVKLKNPILMTQDELEAKARDEAAAAERGAKARDEAAAAERERRGVPGANITLVQGGGGGFETVENRSEMRRRSQRNQVFEFVEEIPQVNTVKIKTGFYAAVKDSDPYLKNYTYTFFELPREAHLYSLRVLKLGIDNALKNESTKERVEEKTQRLDEEASRPLTTGSGVEIFIVQGDITNFGKKYGEGKPCSIVNAANRYGIGGQGIDLAINKRGGEELIRERINEFYRVQELDQTQIDALVERALNGDAVGIEQYMTEIPVEPALVVGNAVEQILNRDMSGRLDLISVIHAVGPDFRQKDNYGRQIKNLRGAYTKVLEIAAEGRTQKLAFPIISGGIFIRGTRHTYKDIARVGIETVIDKLNDPIRNKGSLEAVYFYALDEDNFETLLEIKKEIEIKNSKRGQGGGFRKGKKSRKTKRKKKRKQTKTKRKKTKKTKKTKQTNTKRKKTTKKKTKRKRYSKKTKRNP